MDYSIRYLTSDDLYIVKTGGHTVGQDFVAMAEGLLHHPKWAQNKNVLFDHQELDFEHMSVKDLEEIRDFHRKNEIKMGAGKSAIVVRSGLLTEWNRIWSQGEKTKNEDKVRIFENYHGAINWIKE